MQLSPQYEHWYAEAQRYEAAGDVYHAFKLYKQLVKKVPEWPLPYLALARMYHKRKEWKPAFHYFKKTVALLPDQREAWWSLGIAATALKKWRLARSIWSKFGLTELQAKPEGLRLSYNGLFEILWIKAIDPARAKILSIPHPASGFRFRDIVLYERKAVGHHIVNHKRVVVYNEMGLFKRSPFTTFSCLLHNVDEKQIEQLEKLCYDDRIGFEIWSNAARTMVIDHPNSFPEYYGRSILPEEDKEQAEHALVAIAAVHQAEVLRVLDAWQIISFGQYSDLKAYNV